MVPAWIGGTSSHDFGCEDDLVAALTGGEPAANVGFGSTDGVGIGWDWIELSCVYEVYSFGEGIVELVVGFFFGVLFAPCHCAGMLERRGGEGWV